MRHLLVVLGVQTTLVFPLLAVVPSASAQTNVALNKTVIASSTEGSYAPRLGVDGSPGTRWGSGFATKSATDVEWFLLDLAVVHDLTTVRITWEAAYAEAYQVQVSQDGTTFQTVLSRASAGGSDTLTLPSGVSGRYVRLWLTRKHHVWGSYWGYSFWELQVFGTLRAAPPPSETTLLNRPLRLVTWNIQHGDRDDDVRDIETQMDLLAELGADVIVLQEMHTWDGDYPALYRDGISRRTGVAWHGVYESHTGPSCNGPEGVMILTWLPVISSSHSRMQGVPGSPCDWATRVVLRVELSFNGRQVQLFDTHLTNDVNTSYRAIQFPLLDTFVRGFSGEKLLGGDFNTRPEESLWTLLSLGDAWMDLVYSGDTGYTQHASDQTPPFRRVDYWRRSEGNLRVREIAVVQTLRSDHNPVILDVDVIR